MIEFVKSKKAEILTVGGWAGTGKTTTVAHTVKTLREMDGFKDLTIAFCAFTGKAATVLKSKLILADAFGPYDYCGTIHGLIYQPNVDDHGHIKWIRVPTIRENIIIIDEASMVNDVMIEDLKSYGVPIIAVGDHGQLPPVISRYNLMENPMIRLEKIHRQAENNPIIHWSMLARTGQKIPFGEINTSFGSAHHTNADPIKLMKIIIRQWKQNRIDMRNVMVLCGTNNTRICLNNFFRTQLGITSPLPQKFDRVICLKNNKREGIYNGMVGTLMRVKSGSNKDFLDAEIVFDFGGTPWDGDIFKHQFGQRLTLKKWTDYQRRISYSDQDLRNLFDYGYVLTVHKSQGSQAEEVVLINERFNGMSDDDYRRWLYTGITRAIRNLTIVSI